METTQDVWLSWMVGTVIFIKLGKACASKKGSVRYVGLFTRMAVLLRMLAHHAETIT